MVLQGAPIRNIPTPALPGSGLRVQAKLVSAERSAPLGVFCCLYLLSYRKEGEMSITVKKVTKQWEKQGKIKYRKPAEEYKEGIADSPFSVVL